MTTPLLGDTVARAYGDKLALFNRFAEPELRAIIDALGLHTGERVLDVGCGVGLFTNWLGEQVMPGGVTIGLDLASAHARESQRRAPQVDVVQASALQMPFASSVFDCVWSGNTLNHMRDPVAALRGWTTHVRRGGRIVLGQSHLLVEMFFAWDARLEAAVLRANRQYYRDKYGLDERDVTATRNLVGWMRQAGLRDLVTKTWVIERVQPLSTADGAYFVECVFNGYWAHRVRPYLADDDWLTLRRLCDPASAEFCLERPDFHHAQTYTVVQGTVA